MLRQASQGSYALREYVVVSNEEVAENIFALTLNCPDLAQSIVPGQFINLGLPQPSAHLLRIPLSFFRSDVEAGTVDVAYAVVGRGTEELSCAQPGALGTLVGPCGRGWAHPEGKPGVNCLVVSGGIGAPPCIAATRMLEDAGYPCSVISGSRSKYVAWGEEEYASAGAKEFIQTTDDGSLGFHGFVSDAMRERGLSDIAAIYACGPEPMLKSVAQIASQEKIPCYVSLERMMSCGFGACNTCNVAMADGSMSSCCSDGPVFRAEEVLW